MRLLFSNSVNGVLCDEGLLKVVVVDIFLAGFVTLLVKEVLLAAFIGMAEDDTDLLRSVGPTRIAGLAKFGSGSDLGTISSSAKWFSKPSADFAAL